MASIQQSFNQMLYTGTVGAGLYAHSPEGQRMAKVKELSTEQKVLTKKALIEQEGDLTPANYEKLGELEDKKFNLTGREKYANKAKEYYMKEIDAEESLQRRAMERLNQDEGLKERFDILNKGGKP